MFYLFLVNTEVNDHFLLGHLIIQVMVTSNTGTFKALTIPTKNPQEFMITTSHMLRENDQWQQFSPFVEI